MMKIKFLLNNIMESHENTLNVAPLSCSIVRLYIYYTAFPVYFTLFFSIRHFAFDIFDFSTFFFVEKLKINFPFELNQSLKILHLIPFYIILSVPCSFVWFNSGSQTSDFSGISCFSSVSVFVKHL